MSCQGFTIDNIFIELINLEMFDDMTLVYLLTTNRQLYIVTTKKIQSILKKRYLECVELGDTIDFYSFYRYYIKRILHVGIQMKYSYCPDCHQFGLLTKLDKIGYSNKLICEYGCILKCCGINNIIPRYYDDLLTLKCEHCVILYDNYKCQCGNLVIDNTKKCAKCNNIPFREGMNELLITCHIWNYLTGGTLRYTS